MGQEKEYRHELKYVCDMAQLRMIEERIKHICKPDPHAGMDGIYSIRSVYFDDYRNTCFYENENGIDPREKFRIRIYDGSMERIVLECKRKQSGKTHKDSLILTKEQCHMLLTGEGIDEWEPKLEEKLLNKLMLQYRTKLLRPVVVVEYERIPYVYDMGNVRITMDCNLKGTKEVGCFEEKEIAGRPIMMAGYHILEVKYDEFLPDYIYNALQLKNLRQTAFSKYYLCRKFKG